jgi:hypothetical protein
MIDLTKMTQQFARPVLHAPVEQCRREMLRLVANVVPDARIALAVGSRGIAHVGEFVATMVEVVRDAGAQPFIVPAMGSHGGATAEGQAGVLASYGITEKQMGAPVMATMQTVDLPRGDSPVPVCMDAYAAEADGVIILNRIKPHTSFHGRYESGLTKMAAIGLGKQRQAARIHSLGLAGLREVMPRVGAAVLGSGKIIGGIAVVENAYDETMHIEGLLAGEIAAREPELLEMARENMPHLPLRDIDILIVDRIGKDISGLGMDPNIIGRLGILGQPDPPVPHIRAIIVRDLTEATHGNALGIGLADITTRQLVDKIDYSAMYENALTTTFVSRAKIPLVAETDECAFEYACRICGDKPERDRVVLRIQDTLHLSEFWASSAAACAVDASRIDA